MSYPERRTIVSIVTGALILAIYCIYAFGRPAAGTIAAGDLKSWATTILIFIGASILAGIIIQIVFHILLSVSVAVKGKIRDQDLSDEAIEKNIRAEIVEDEMDKLIELKSVRVGLFFGGAGFILALVALVFDFSPVVMLNILFIAFSLGSLAQGIAQLYYYRRGVLNG